MTKTLGSLWKRMKGVDRSRRVFAAYLLIVFVVAMTAQGIASSPTAVETTSTPEPAVAEAPAETAVPAVEEAPGAVDEAPVEEPALLDPADVTPGEDPADAVVAPEVTVLQELPDVQIVATLFNDDGAGSFWGNGIYDGADEGWLGGFTFELYSGPAADGPWTYVTSATSVDANGQADFGMQPAGWYKIVETLTDDQIFNGWECTTSGGVMVFQANGEQNAGLWFGNVQRTVIEVYKYLDEDEDGRHDDAEKMLEGWEFTLYDSAGTKIMSGLTDADGKLVFWPVPTGDYYVTETQQDGWENTTPLTRELAIAGQCTEVWFGNSPDRGDLEVYKYSDNNENARYDLLEEMLGGWEFTLYDSTGAKVDSGFTDANGLLVFSDLAPGEYSVTETLKDGWTNTTSLTQKVTVVDDGTASVWFGNVVYREFTELDLAITKVADDHTVDEGQIVTYTLTYWNLMSEEDAYDYTIVDDYDERYLTIVNAGGGTVANGKITWRFPGPLSSAMGKQTITYTARVSADMPDSTTYIDNVVVIDDDRDFNLTNNRDDERVVYTPGEPYLPFTGGEYTLLIGFAVAAAALGLLLRLRTDNAA